MGRAFLALLCLALWCCYPVLLLMAGDCGLYTCKLPTPFAERLATDWSSATVCMPVLTPFASSFLRAATLNVSCLLDTSACCKACDAVVTHVCWLCVTFWKVKGGVPKVCPFGGQGCVTPHIYLSIYLELANLRAAYHASCSVARQHTTWRAWWCVASGVSSSASSHGLWPAASC